MSELEVPKPGKKFKVFSFSMNYSHFLYLLTALYMLGEQLFPLVKSIELDFSGKVTGMLLEMDKTEVLHLLPRCFEEKSFISHGRFGVSWTHVLR
ncbi:hypothetical protein MKX03_002202, partial [Papaver bracteatum]